MLNEIQSLFYTVDSLLLMDMQLLWWLWNMNNLNFIEVKNIFFKCAIANTHAQVIMVWSIMMWMINLFAVHCKAFRWAIHWLIKNSSHLISERVKIKLSCNILNGTNCPMKYKFMQKIISNNFSRAKIN